jgi:hypothetical protein
MNESPMRSITAPLQPGSARLVAMVVGTVLATGAALLIGRAPGVMAQWDQSFIAHPLSASYPHFESGIVSHLLVGMVNALVPYDPVSSNTLIRVLAATFYLAAAALLAWSVTGPKRLWGFVAFMLLVASSRFPFLWLSSELFAGAFLMLFLWSLVRRHPFPVTGLLLVLFSLSKADLALPGALIGAYLVFRPDPLPVWRRAAILGGMAALLVVPSLFTPSYYAQFGGRTWVSFGQHYGELVRVVQVGAAPPGWTAGGMYKARGFPGAGSVWEAALAYPRRYIYFVSLSMAESGIRLGLAKVAFLIPIAGYFFMRMERPWKITVLLLLTSFVPIILLSFLHVRYQARFYPLALFVIFAGLRAGSYPRRHELALAGVLALLLLWQVVDLVPVLPTAYWLPD